MPGSPWKGPASAARTSMAATRPGHKNWKPNTETEKTETEQIRLFFGYQSAETELISVFGFLFRFKPKTGILLDCTVLSRFLHLTLWIWLHGSCWALDYCIVYLCWTALLCCQTFVLCSCVVFCSKPNESAENICILLYCALKWTDHDICISLYYVVRAILFVFGFFG